ncbi:hypothetical protein PR048_008509 [Dryococelus australis]|uniref:Uncharacterized protein n=1 Tax=Dryococelus australis TaxID=614101 RepID=A0ABQ9HY82_9NEOP|nr:hypothetical protein PR048_008509 [Dryococelus australis]
MCEQGAACSKKSSSAIYNGERGVITFTNKITRLEDSQDIASLCRSEAAIHSACTRQQDGVTGQRCGGTRFANQRLPILVCAHLVVGVTTCLKQVVCCPDGAETPHMFHGYSFPGCDAAVLVTGCRRSGTFNSAWPSLDDGRLRKDPAPSLVLAYIGRFCSPVEGIYATCSSRHVVAIPLIPWFNFNSPAYQPHTPVPDTRSRRLPFRWSLVVFYHSELSHSFIHSNSTPGPEAACRNINWAVLAIPKVQHTPSYAERTRSVIQSILQISAENNATRVSKMRRYRDHLAGPLYVSIPGGVLPDFPVLETWRTLPWVSEFSRATPVSLTLAFCQYSISNSLCRCGPEDLISHNVHETRRKHCKPIQSLERSGDGAFDARINIILIAPALVCLERENSLTLDVNFRERWDIHIEFINYTRGCGGAVTSPRP